MTVSESRVYYNEPLTEHFNPLNAELNPICYLLALLTHHFLHVSRIRVKGEQTVYTYISEVTQVFLLPLNITCKMRIYQKLRKYFSYL